jgi:hypothetical protein
MKFLRMTVVMGLVALAFGCSGSGVDDIRGARSERVALDVRCATDVDCPNGFECEAEHGTSWCKSHGGSSSSDGGVSSSTPNRSCSTDADCSPGLECEIEVEHGVTTSFCKPHGGGKSGKH